MVGAEGGGVGCGSEQEVEVERREARVVARAAEERAGGGGVRGGERREGALRREMGDGEREERQGGVERDGGGGGGALSSLWGSDLRRDEALVLGDDGGELPREAVIGRPRKGKVLGFEEAGIRGVGGQWPPARMCVAVATSQCGGNELI